MNDVFFKDIDLKEGATLPKQAFEFYIYLMIKKRLQRDIKKITGNIYINAYYSLKMILEASKK